MKWESNDDDDDDGDGDDGRVELSEGIVERMKEEVIEIWKSIGDNENEKEKDNRNNENEKEREFIIIEELLRVLRVVWRGEE